MKRIPTRPLLILLFVVFFILFWWKLFVGQEIPFAVDTLCFYFPNWAIGKHLLREGFYFLWDPFRNMGQPFLAVPQNQALYPPRLMGAFFSYGGYMRFVITFHTILMTVFGYLFAKKWTGDPRAGIFSALCFGFGGLVFIRCVFTADFCVMAWLPCLLYLLLSRKTIWLSVALSWQWMAGYPPLFLLGFLVLTVFALAQESWKQDLLCLLKASTLMMGLIAVQFIPFLEMWRESIRPVLIDPKEAVMNSVPWHYIVRGLFSLKWSVDFEASRVIFFAGPLLSILFIWGVLQKKRGVQIFSAVWLVCMTLALGPRTKIDQILPLVRLFRYPGHWLWPAYAMLVLLAILGFERLKQHSVKIVFLTLIALHFLFNARTIYFPWGDAPFITTLSERLTGLENKPQRVWHSEEMIASYPYWDWSKDETWHVLKQALLPSYGAAFGISEVTSHHNLTSARVWAFRGRLLTDPHRQELFDAAGVDRLIVEKNHTGVAVRLEDFSVLANPQAKPPVFVVDSTTRPTVLSSKPGTIRVNAMGPGVLVASQGWFPGWKAKVDHQPVNVEIFENIFPSVRLEAGPHEVEFHYAPTSFLMGAWLSGLTFFSLMLYVGLLVFRKLNFFPRYHPVTE